VKTDATLDWLAEVSIFRGLSRKDLTAIRNTMRERDFAAGETVVAQGESEGRFYLITEGKATVLVGTTTRNVLGPGDYFGEISLIDHGPRMATVRADTPLHTMTLAPFTFRPMLQSHADIAYAVLVEMCNRIRMAGAVEC
jgi:CRP/FNR family cyclic AMP-dependent transcriptional regulator